MRFCKNKNDREDDTKLEMYVDRKCRNRNNFLRQPCQHDVKSYFCNVVVIASIDTYLWKSVTHCTASSFIYYWSTISVFACFWIAYKSKTSAAITASKTFSRWWLKFVGCDLIWFYFAEKLFPFTNPTSKREPASCTNLDHSYGRWAGKARNLK